MRDLQKQSLAKIEEAYVIAEKHFDKPIPRVPVKFSTKLTSTAGKLRFSRLTGQSIDITLSTPILRDNPEEFVSRTPGHEAAHHIVHMVYGVSKRVTAHGREWQFVMNLIGQDAARCHTMETTSRNKAPRIAANCECQTHMITKQRVNKMRRGVTYKCNKCKTRLVLADNSNTRFTATFKGPQLLVPPVAKKPVAKKPVAKKAPGSKSNAERARELITRNPRATEAELVELLRASDIPVKANMLKVVIKVNVLKVRG